MKNNKIWDIYTRLFHWLFSSTIILTIILADIDTFWHFETAKFITTLFIFRIIWGVIGYKTAVFINFFPTIKHIKQYMTGAFTKVMQKKVVIINKGVISTKIDNNTTFWNLAYNMIFKTLDT